MAITPMRRLMASRSLPGQVDLLGSRASVIGGRDSLELSRRTEHGQIPFEASIRGVQSSGGALPLLWRVDVAGRRGVLCAHAFHFRSALWLM